MEANAPPTLLRNRLPLQAHGGKFAGTLTKCRGVGRPGIAKRTDATRALERSALRRSNTGCRAGTSHRSFDAPQTSDANAAIHSASNPVAEGLATETRSDSWQGRGGFIITPRMLAIVLNDLNKDRDEVFCRAHKFAVSVKCDHHAAGGKLHCLKTVQIEGREGMFCFHKKDDTPARRQASMIEGLVG